MRVFRDRRDAGRQLARALVEAGLPPPGGGVSLVLAIPRGGTIVAREVADELHADLDIVLVAKLRASMHPELAIGALGESGATVLTAAAEMVPPSPAYLGQERRRAAAELERRAELFRARLPPFDVRARWVVLVDDGIATGASMLVAVQLVRQHAPAGIVVAAPVAAASAVSQLRRLCEGVVCVEVPAAFFAISEFYRSFPQLDDNQALAALVDRARG